MLFALWFAIKGDFSFNHLSTTTRWKKLRTTFFLHFLISMQNSNSLFIISRKYLHRHKLSTLLWRRKVVAVMNTEWVTFCIVTSWKVGLVITLGVPVRQRLFYADCYNSLRPFVDTVRLYRSFLLLHSEIPQIKMLPEPLQKFATI